MPINVNDPEYVQAEKDYYESKSPEAKLNALKKMISHAPSHKGGENLRQQLTTRRKKIEQEIEKKKKTGKSTKIGIKKDEIQAVIVGNSNSGKSSLLEAVTNTNPIISEIKYSTVEPFVGMMPYGETNIQLIENPAAESEYYDRGMPHTADVIILLITNLEEILPLEKIVEKTPGKKMIVVNKIDLLTENEKRKFSANLKSKYKRYPFVLISAKDKENLEQFKEKLFPLFEKIRVYTKEPGKEKSTRPVILSPGSTVKHVAEKILHGFSKNIKETKIWGPSSKFGGQKVGLKHRLRDLDVVEFKTK